jgi:hypothetical protein
MRRSGVASTKRLIPANFCGQVWVQHRDPIHRGPVQEQPRIKPDRLRRRDVARDQAVAQGFGVPTGASIVNSAFPPIAAI